jgi:hypothetical protein
MAATMMSILRNGIARERKFGAGSSLEDCLFQHLWKFFNLPLCPFDVAPLDIRVRRTGILLKMLDYLAIYPLIAGTFTPLCLVPFHNSTIGWSFCAVVWFLAIVGMVFTYKIHGSIPKWMSMTTYLTLGWLGALMSYWLWGVLGVVRDGTIRLGWSSSTAGGYVYTTGNSPIRSQAVLAFMRFGTSLLSLEARKSLVSHVLLRSPLGPFHVILQCMSKLFSEYDIDRLKLTPNQFL